MLHRNRGTIGIITLGTLLALSARPALADTTITTATTSPLSTATAGNVTVASGGSITVSGGPAVRIDSNSNVTNGGTIDAGNPNGAIGIQLDAGRTSTISNTGTIRVIETFSVADADNNGVADGPIAQASGRYGIYVAPGASAAGSIANTGTIQVDGLNSAGIFVDNAFNGSISSTGPVTVTGDNSYGIRTRDVTGSITVGGQVSVVGEGAIGLAVDGNVGGKIALRGTITQATNFRTDDGRTVNLSRADLTVGAPAVSIAGNVAGGVHVESTGAIQSFGNGAALRIGGAGNTTIGPIVGNTAGRAVLIEGTLTATSPFSATSASALVLGGQGGTVTLGGGLAIGGQVKASTLDGSATAVLINTGVTMPVLYNSGTIGAFVNSAGAGSAYGIRDLSGNLTVVENTKVIQVQPAGGDVGRAIDLSANTTGVTIRQFLNAADAAARAAKEATLPPGQRDTTVYASIIGDIVTGSGNDLLSANTGRITGATYFNDGNDRLELAGDAAYRGRVFFGNGTATMSLAGFATFSGNVDFAGQAATLTLGGTSNFAGTLSGSSNLAVTVNGGVFGAEGFATLNMASLNVASGGALNVNIDGRTGSYSKFAVSGNATFATGSHVTVSLASLENAVGTYSFLNAGTLVGTPQLDPQAGMLPYIFAGSLAAAGNTLQLQIRRKTVAELGVTASSASALDAIVAAAPQDASVSAAILRLGTGSALQNYLNQAVPDHAGGVFYSAVQGSRLASRHAAGDASFFAETDTGFWLEPLYWQNSKDAGETTAFRSRGWGMSAGYERKTSFGMIGLSYAYLDGKLRNNGGTGTIATRQHEIGLHWRMESGAFHAYSRGSAAQVRMVGQRTLQANDGVADFARVSNAKWTGWLFSGAAGASYQVKIGDHIVVKPVAAIDFYRFSEGAYTEAGGTKATDYAVRKRTSENGTLASTLMLSYRTSPWDSDGRPLTFELEGGRRTHLWGQLGATSASLNGGTVFSMAPEPIGNNWLGEARVLLGGWDHTLQLAGRIEQSNGRTAYSASLSLSGSF
ncbi:MAG: autotransporter outer membrane beta-barrel domain-containing protein [Casimicrobium sp.]